MLRKRIQQRVPTSPTRIVSIVQPRDGTSSWKSARLGIVYRNAAKPPERALEPVLPVRKRAAGTQLQPESRPHRRHLEMLEQARLENVAPVALDPVPAEGSVLGDTPVRAPLRPPVVGDHGRRRGSQQGEIIVPAALRREQRRQMLDGAKPGHSSPSSNDASFAPAFLEPSAREHRATSSTRRRWDKASGRRLNGEQLDVGESPSARR